MEFTVTSPNTHPPSEESPITKPTHTLPALVPSRLASVCIQQLVKDEEEQKAKHLTTSPVMGCKALFRRWIVKDPSVDKGVGAKEGWVTPAYSVFLLVCLCPSFMNLILTSTS